MRLFDAHCHLQDEKLAADAEGVMTRARAAGVEGMLCCATEEKDWGAVEEVSRRFEGVIPAFGVHPWYMGSRTAGWQERLRERLAAMPAAGVGEIGLDHAIRERCDEEQMSVFVDLMNLAGELQRPVSIHCRQAWGAMMDVLGRLGPGLPGFMVHSYSGAVDHLEGLTKAGGYVSFSGTITRTRNVRGKEAAKAVALERLLIETDSPDLMPIRPAADGSGNVSPDKDVPNEPANLVFVCRKIAELRGMPEDEVAEITSRNARRLFWGKDSGG